MDNDDNNSTIIVSDYNKVTGYEFLPALKVKNRTYIKALTLPSF